jgi:DNA-binding transcriptional MerR regulator
MQDREFDLKELCEAAHVTERTVRYYIAEGLLSPPVGLKSQSRYTTEHLERLQLIQNLKEQDFSLRQIKALLEGNASANIKPLLEASDFAGQAAEFLNRQPAPPQAKPYGNPFNPASQGEQAGNSSGVYQSLNRAGYNPTKPAGVNPPHPLQMGFTRSWPGETAQGLEREVKPVEPGPENTPSNELSNLWEKLTIAPGIELLLDKNIADRYRANLPNLAEQIKRKLDQ